MISTPARALDVWHFKSCFQSTSSNPNKLPGVLGVRRSSAENKADGREAAFRSAIRKARNRENLMSMKRVPKRYSSSLTLGHRAFPIPPSLMKWLHVESGVCVVREFRLLRLISF